MSDATNRTDQINRFNDEMRRYAKWNFFTNSLEGGLYMAGMIFVSRETILPPIVKSLGGPPWMISLSSTIMLVGLSLPSIFFVHYFERLKWKKPVLILSGFFQRLPLLLAGLALLFLADSHPLLTLILVAFAPFFSGFCCGLTFPAWIELVGKTVPANRRASLFAVRLLIASGVGLAGGVLISRILREWPGATGYGVLHLICFGFLTISYVIFCMIKETNLPPPEKQRVSSLRESVKEIPSILKNDRNFRNYLLNRLLASGGFIVVPFIPIYALRALDMPESFLGDLVIAGVAGSITGNFFAAYVGDKCGGKVGAIFARAGFIVVFIASTLIHRPWLFFALFFALGFCRDCALVSRSTLSMELCPLDKRQKYMSVLYLLTFPGILLASLGGAWIWEQTDNYAFLAILSSIIVAISLIYLIKVDEPRAVNESNTAIRK